MQRILLLALIVGALSTVAALAVGRSAYGDADGACPFDTHVVGYGHGQSGVVQQVTHTPYLCEYGPSWSNDGKRIITHGVVLDADGNFLHQDLYVANVASGQEQLLPGTTGDSFGDYSPNDRLIAFNNGFPPDLYVMPSAGGVPVMVAAGGADPDWSPNSKLLVYYDFLDGSIRTTSIDGSAQAIVEPPGTTPPESPFMSSGVAWSPNGHLIAYSDNTDIFVVQVTARGEPLGPPLRLTHGEGPWNSRPSFTQNSKTIVFSSGRGPGFLCEVPVTGGIATPILGPTQTEQYDPEVSNNGQWIAYSGRTP